MKVKIRYNYDPLTGDNPFWAIANDAAYACSPTSFEDAKRKLMEQINRNQPREGMNIPPEEEVEI